LVSLCLSGEIRRYSMRNKARWLKLGLVVGLVGGMAIMLLHAPGCGKKSSSKSVGSSGQINYIKGTIIVTTSEETMVPLGGATVTAQWSGSGKSILAKGIENESRSTRTKSDGSYELTGIPRNTVVTITVTSPDTIQSVETITTSETTAHSSAILKGHGKKIGLIKQSQETVLNTFDDTSMPQCQVSIPADAVTSTVDNVFLTPTHQGENLPQLPDGYIFLTGADFSAPSTVIFASGKEADPYIILPDSVKAEVLSTADIKLMEYINGSWVINTGKGKLFSTGAWAGYLGPDDVSPARLKGVHPWCWAVDKTGVGAAEVTGTVKDNSGNPINGALVFGGGVKTNTQSDGTYTLKNIGVITSNTLVPINVTAVGYQMDPQFVSLAPAGTLNNKDFALKPVSQSAEVYGQVINQSDNTPIYGAIVTLQTGPSIRGMKYNDNNTPTDLTDDTFYVIPPPGVNITNYKWMLTTPLGVKFDSTNETGVSVVLQQLAIEATTHSVALTEGAYKVELEVTYSGGKKAIVSGGLLIKDTGFIRYIADVKLPVSLQDQLFLKTVTDPQGNYRFIKLPTDEIFYAQARALDFITSNKVTISALSAGEQRLHNFSLVDIGTDTEAPGQPSNLTGTARSVFSILLTWSASSDNIGIDHYRVYRDYVEIAKTTATSFIDSGLQADTSYTYQIGAFDMANNSAMSIIITVTTPADIPDTEPPTTPTNLTAVVVGPSQINLSWWASSDDVGVIGYKVYQSTNGTDYALRSTPNATNDSATGLSNSTVYWYKVTAYDAAGNESDYSNVITATTPALPDNKPPEVPAGLTATAVSSGQINLSWNASTDTADASNSASGVTGYKVYRSTDGSNFSFLTNSPNTSHSNSGLSANTQYWYKVVAFDAVGNISAQSNEATATTMPMAGDLVAYWKFDEGSGTLAADSSGNGNNGTVYGATWTGGCLSFDGTAGNYVIRNPMNLPANEITCSFWMKTSRATIDSGIISYAIGPSPYDNAFTIMSCQRSQICRSPDGELVMEGISTNDGNWHHIAATWRSSDGQTNLYKDGVLVYTGTIATGAPIPQGGSLVIGQDQDVVGGGFNGTQAFLGQLDDVKIYNYARSAGDIQAEYNNSAAAHWTQKITQGAGGSPSARYKHTMVWDGTKVIMFGGYDAGTYKNDLWWYDPGTNTWTQKIANGTAGSPSARYAYKMVWDGTRVIMFGGYGGTYRNDLWWYDPGTNTWTEKIADGTTGSPSVRYNHSMVWDGTKVIMFGGCVWGGTFYNDLWWYDPGTNIWTEKIAQGTVGSPPATYTHEMVWDETRVIMFGGYGETPASCKNALWWYDPGTNTWTEKIAQGTIGSPLRYDHKMVWDGTRVIMFGGADESNRHNNIWWYDPGTNTWIQKIADGTAGSPPVRDAHSMVWDGTRVIMFGGYDAAYKNDLWWYSP
jgi:chitodextrinase